MTRSPLNFGRAGRTLRNAFRSEGTRLFGWPFVRDYLAVALDSARRWGATEPGSLDIVGFRVEYFNRSDAVFLLHEIFVNGAYFFPSPSPAPRIIDCGANIGMATLFFKALYPSSSVTAVEPAPQTFERLAQNVSRNQLRDVRLINAAVAERPGSISMRRHQSNPGSLVAATNASPAGGAGTVQAITLSSLLDEPADFVKLDVEGAEYGVIRDVIASGRIAHVRRMVLEYHDVNTRSEELQGVIDALRASGMDVVRRDDAGTQTGILRVSR